MKNEVPLKNDYFKISVSGTIATASAITSIVINLSVNICDSLTLKLLIMFLLTLTFVLACYVFNLVLQRSANFFKYILILASFVFYCFLGVYVLTKKCAKAPSVTPEIKGGNIDNSVHIDNRKNYNLYKPFQRRIKSIDIATLKSELPEKNAKILVQYLKDRPIDTLLSKQIIKELFDLGYSDVNLSSATNLPDNLKKGAVTIFKEKIDYQSVYKVIINPQP